MTQIIILLEEEKEEGNKHTILKLNSSFLVGIFSLVESCELMSVPGEERTVLHAQYPARIAEKNTKMNLRGHIWFCFLEISTRERERGIG